jgi:transcription elongation GreA/GreB family factor
MRRLFFLKGNLKYMSDNNLKQQKHEMWTKKLADLQKELEAATQRKGEAAREGDLSENAAYKMALEDIDMLNARIIDIEKILSDLEKGGK